MQTAIPTIIACDDDDDRGDNMTNMTNITNITASLLTDDKCCTSFNIYNTQQTSANLKKRVFYLTYDVKFRSPSDSRYDGDALRRQNSSDSSKLERAQVNDHVEGKRAESEQPQKYAKIEAQRQPLREGNNYKIVT